MITYMLVSLTIGATLTCALWIADDEAPKWWQAIASSIVFAIIWPLIALGFVAGSIR